MRAEMTNKLALYDHAFKLWKAFNEFFDAINKVHDMSEYIVDIRSGLEEEYMIFLDAPTSINLIRLANIWKVTRANVLKELIDRTKLEK